MIRTTALSTKYLKIAIENRECDVNNKITENFGAYADYFAQFGIHPISTVSLLYLYQSTVFLRNLLNNIFGVKWPTAAYSGVRRLIAMYSGKQRSIAVYRLYLQVLRNEIEDL